MELYSGLSREKGQLFLVLAIVISLPKISNRG